MLSPESEHSAEIPQPSEPSNASVEAGVPAKAASSSAAGASSAHSAAPRHHYSAAAASAAAFLPTLQQHAYNSSMTPHSSSSPIPVLQSYFSRLSNPRTLDLHSALSQMRHLLRLSDGIGTGPSRVYKAAYYRKQTKDHWARDDPSFCVLEVLWMMIACVVWTMVWGGGGSAADGAAAENANVGVVGLVLRSVLWHWIVIGAGMTEAGRRVSERLATAGRVASVVGAARGGGRGRHVRQSVEWMYAWDIHCNSYFVWFVVVWGVHFFLSPFLVGESLLPFIMSNALYAAAFSWYFYVTHLGYRALPFLSNTEVFLYPIVAVLLLCTLNIIFYPLGLGVNPSGWAVRYYFGANILN